MERKYIAVINEKDDYEVIFPDFLECFETGSNLSETLERAQKALELYIAGMVKNGEEIPEESKLPLVMATLNECDGILHLEWVRVNLPPSKAVRINITIPEDLLRRVDKRLAGRKNRRSSFIARALEHELEVQ